LDRQTLAPLTFASILWVSRPGLSIQNTQWRSGLAKRHRIVQKQTNRLGPLRADWPEPFAHRMRVVVQARRVLRHQHDPALADTTDRGFHVSRQQNVHGYFGILEESVRADRACLRTAPLRVGAFGTAREIFR